MADALASQLIVASHAVVYPAVAGVQDLSIQQLAAIPRFIKRALPDQVGAIMVHNHFLVAPYHLATRPGSREAFLRPQRLGDVQPDLQ